jgi:hypothetical protein
MLFLQSLSGVFGCEIKSIWNTLLKSQVSLLAIAAQVNGFANQ